MSVTERETLDFALLLSKTEALSDALLRSVEVADYLYWKERKENDPEAARLAAKMARAKERFEECERFGHYHPDYREALAEVKEAEAEAERVESVREFKRAEKALEKLLYDVSVVIARAVSDSVKVSGGDLPEKSGCGGCGSCSGGCSSCGL